MNKKQLLTLLEQFNDAQEIVITTEVKSVGAALSVAGSRMEVMFNLDGVEALPESVAGADCIALIASFGD